MLWKPCVLIIAAALTVPAAAGLPAAVADPLPDPAATDSGGPPALSEVTITARLALQARVSSFVYEIAGLGSNGDGVPRWKAPVCPRVAGLSRKQGEAILSRLSEIGRAAGVPLAGEACSPNLIVLVSADPPRELAGLHRRSRLVMFGYEPPGVVDDFLASRLPVNVWYTTVASSNGTPVGGRSLNEKTPVLRAPSVPAVNGPTRLRSNVVQGLGQVFVIVDRRQLHEVSLGQLADYLAMVGLAQIKPGAHLGDTETILRLFDAGPKAAPAGLSGWDQAFLKALYATDQESIRQRDDLARTMVGEILAPPPSSPSVNQ